ncbi:uncharacterized protein METZ01_LOCUS486774, partial [marine metagenome]
MALSKKSNKVYFLNPPTLHNSFKTDIDNDLKIIDYKPFFRGSNKLPIWFRKIFHKEWAKEIKHSFNGSIDITWSFDPSSFQYLGAFGGKLNIFHPVDVHKPNFEKATAKHADVILATSDKILERYKEFNKPKLKVNHGLADQFLSSTHINKNIIQRNDRINVGYMGNLHYQHLDTIVLKDIITLNPNVDFYFIGPYEKSNIG